MINGQSIITTMEPQASKLGINILIIVSIILIAGSLFVTSTKKPEEQAVVVKPVITNTAAEMGTSELKNGTTTTETNLATTTGNMMTSSSSQMGASTTTPLSSKSWIWTKTVATGAKDITPKKQTAFTVTFNATGTVSGTTDCNTFFGSYKSDATKLSFGPLGSTRMFCEDSQEGVFLAEMEGVKSYIIDSSKNLILTTGSSTMYFK